jgi:hypothetical protein
MTHLVRFIAALVGWLRRSPAEREAEIVYLRQQLIVLKRSTPARPRLKATDRLIFVCLYRLFPSLLDASFIFKPETLLRWHRTGFRLFWRWKSRRRAGRPSVSADIRSLVRRISRENPLWGAPRIHGELLKLGIEIAQSTVAKYMVRRRGPPSQGWKTFLRNHSSHIAAIDMFVVPTIGFGLLYGLAIIRLGRRKLVWTNVTANPTAEWRMPRSCCGPGRGPSSPSSQGLRRLLQPRPYPSCSCERRPYWPACAYDWIDRGHPVPRRPSPPIRRRV